MVIINLIITLTVNVTDIKKRIFLLDDRVARSLYLSENSREIRIEYALYDLFPIFHRREYGIYG